MRLGLCFDTKEFDSVDRGSYSGDESLFCHGLGNVGSRSFGYSTITPHIEQAIVFSTTVIHEINLVLKLYRRNLQIIEICKFHVTVWSATLQFTTFTLWDTLTITAPLFLSFFTCDYKPYAPPIAISWISHASPIAAIYRLLERKSWKTEMPHVSIN